LEGVDKSFLPGCEFLKELETFTQSFGWNDLHTAGRAYSADISKNGRNVLIIPWLQRKIQKAHTLSLRSFSKCLVTLEALVTCVDYERRPQE
jgi:hypothetical protein